MDFQTLSNGLDKPRTDCITHMLATISMQAEALRFQKALSDVDEAADWYKETAIAGISLVQLAAKMNNPMVKGPSLAQVNDEIATMQDQIKSASDLTQVLNTVLTFALKIAPLCI